MSLLDEMISKIIIMYLLDKMISKINWNEVLVSVYDTEKEDMKKTYNKKQFESKASFENWFESEEW